MCVKRHIRWMVILATLIGTGFYLGSRTGMFYEVQALFWQYYYKLSPVETPYASADDWARKNLDKVIDIQKGRRWGAVYRLPVDIDPADTQAVYQYELKTRSLYFLQQQNNVQEGDWASTFYWLQCHQIFVLPSFSEYIATIFIWVTIWGLF